MSITRRSALIAAPAFLAGCAQPHKHDGAHAHHPHHASAHAHAHHGGLYERLNQPGRIGRPEIAKTQNVFDSPAPKAQRMGRWIARAPLPLPRSEMAWAVALNGRMHIVGGYAEQRVNREYHHAYDPQTDTWSQLAPVPLGANHIGVAVLGDMLYAIGGFVEQNRKPHAECTPRNRWTGTWCTTRGPTAGRGLRPCQPPATTWAHWPRTA